MAKATFINCYFDSFPVNIGKNASNKNVSEYYSSNLRKNKLKTSSWASSSFNKVESVAVTYNSASKEYSFKTIKNFTEGEYVFGLLKIIEEPFKGESSYTALGRITTVKGETVSFQSASLPKKNTTLKLLLN